MGSFFQDSVDYDEIEKLEQQQQKLPTESKPKISTKQQKSGTVEISGFNSKFVITGKKTQKKTSKVKSELETTAIPQPVTETKPKAKESKKLAPPDPIAIHQVDGAPIYDPENVKSWIYPSKLQENINLHSKLPSARLSIQHRVHGNIKKYFGLSPYWFGKNFYCQCDNVQLLPLVPRRNHNIHGPYTSSCWTTNSSVLSNCWYPSR